MCLLIGEQLKHRERRQLKVTGREEQRTLKGPREKWEVLGVHLRKAVPLPGAHRAADSWHDIFHVPLCNGKPTTLLYLQGN